MSMPFFIINSFFLKNYTCIPFKNHFIRWCKVIQAGKKESIAKNLVFVWLKISDITKTAIPKSWYYAVFSRIL